MEKYSDIPVGSMESKSQKGGRFFDEKELMIDVGDAIIKAKVSVEEDEGGIFFEIKVGDFDNLFKFLGDERHRGSVSGGLYDHTMKAILEWLPEKYHEPFKQSDAWEMLGNGVGSAFHKE